MINDEDIIKLLAQRTEELENRVKHLERLSNVSPGAKAYSSSVPLEKHEPWDTNATAKLFMNAEGEKYVKPTMPAEGKSSSETFSKPPASEVKNSSVSNLLGMGGAITLVLAASYLIKLAFSSGWFTPERVIALAVLMGIALVVAGIKLRDSDKEYAGILPAAGIVILFLSFYSAHLKYDLISMPTALSAVSATCFLSLWLCNLFKSTLYAIVAVIGAYSIEVIVPEIQKSASVFFAFYVFWTALFCWTAVYMKSRAVYLLSTYLTLIGFCLLLSSDFLGYKAWDVTEPVSQWIFLSGMLTLLMAAFAVAAVKVSIKLNESLVKNWCFRHIPAVFLFYFTQYEVLERALPGRAPIVLGISALLLLAVYLWSIKKITLPLNGAKLMVTSYVSLVILHAGYIESVSDPLKPCVALIAIIAAILWAKRKQDLAAINKIGWSVIIFLFCINYIAVLFNISSGQIFMSKEVALLYAAVLYLVYKQLHIRSVKKDMLGIERSKIFWKPALIAGHIMAMTALVHILDNRVAISLSWGALAIIAMLLSLQWRDKLLGKSSLLIFLVSITKVLFFDINMSGSTVTLMTLISVGATFYAGGWLYKKIEALE